MKCRNCPANKDGNCILKNVAEQFEFTDGAKGCYLRSRTIIGELEYKGYKVDWKVIMK